MKKNIIIPFFLSPLLLSMICFSVNLFTQTTVLKSVKKNSMLINKNSNSPVIKKLDLIQLQSNQREAAAKNNLRNATIILEEDFEAGFPELNNWWLFWSDFSPYTWDDVAYKPHGGSFSAWCADALMSDFFPVLNPMNDDYPNDLMSWMIWGPFSLEDAVVANLEFWYWYETETDFDFLFYGISPNGLDFSGQYLTGSSAGWQQMNINLGNPNGLLGDWIGEPELWLGFLFISDSIYTEQGAFIDDILLTKNTGTIDEPDILISSNFFDFEDVPLYSSSDLLLQITNLGTSDLNVSSILSTHPNFMANPISLLISPGNSIPVTLTFTPSSLGEIMGSLVIQSDDPDQPSVEIFVVGRGVAQSEPDISFSSSSHQFGNVEVGNISSWMVTVSNIGGQNLQITEIFNLIPDFFFSAVTLPKILLPEDYFSLEITFDPSKAGSMVDSLFFVSNDPDEGDAFIRLTGQGIDMTPPEISHFPPTSAPASQDLSLVATIQDNSQNVSSLLFYRKGGSVPYHQLNMAANENQFTGTIPGSAVTTRGLEYYIAASDGQNMSYFPSTNYSSQPNRIRIEVDNATKPGLQPGGSAENAYRLFSVPLELNANGVDAILFDDLGDYNNTQWRFIRQEGGNHYEYPDSRATSLVAGKAYWLIIKESNKIIDVGSGKSRQSDLPFSITLIPGWNDISLPFNFPVKWTDIEKNPDQLDGPYFYDGNWKLPSSIGQLEPWQGYAVKNLTTGNVSINIHPVAADASSRELKKILNLGGNEEKNWSLQIKASVGAASDEYNYLGYHADASPQKDWYDYSEPPGIGNYVSLYFPHDEWQPYPGNYTTDIRPEFGEGESWKFIVKSNIKDKPIRLSWQDLEKVPPEFDIVLIDLNQKIKINLRDQDYFTFYDDNSRQFSILVGQQEFVQEHEAQLLMPQQFILYQNHPNPFNPETTIRYGIPSASNVRVEIFNLLGQRIITLVNKNQGAGSYSITWNGQQDNGQPAPSGLYIYHFSADKFVQSKKLILMR